MPLKRRAASSSTANILVDNGWSSGESEPEKCPSDDEFDVDSDEDDSYVAFGGKWYAEKDFVPSIPPFTSETGICNVPLTGDSPLDYFLLFFDESLLEIIVDETNRYHAHCISSAAKKTQEWYDVTVDEIYVFITVSMLMGLIRKNQLKDYWSTDPLLETPIFGKTISRHRYLDILHFLHFSNNEETSRTDRLRKIRPIIDDLREKFKCTTNPGRDLCIDESLVLWKGRLLFKQYIPLKRHRFGIKLFELVDSTTNFLIDFIVYTGKDTDYEVIENLGFSGSIVNKLMESYYNKGHILYADNWYVSPVLSKFLYDRQTGLCGTIRKNRKGLPEMETKLNKGETETVCNDTSLVIKWRDRRDVFILTSAHVNEMSSTEKKHYKTEEDIVKPTAIIQYNKLMGGVDIIDRQLSTCETVRKTMKWYKKLFFHCVDLSMINAYALYKMKNPDTPLFVPQIKLEIIREMLKKFSCGTKRVVQRSGNLSHPLRLTARHFPSQLQTKRQCVVCSKHSSRKRTSFNCEDCAVPLCIVPCFKVYHTKENF